MLLIPADWVKPKRMMPLFVCGTIHEYTGQLRICKRLFSTKEFRYVCQSRWYPIRKIFIRKWPRNKYDPWSYHPVYAPTKERLIDLLIQRLDHLNNTGEKFEDLQ